MIHPTRPLEPEPTPELRAGRGAASVEGGPRWRRGIGGHEEERELFLSRDGPFPRLPRTHADSSHSPLTDCGMCGHPSQVVKGEGAGALLTGLGPTAFGYFIQVRRARRCLLARVVLG